MATREGRASFLHSNETHFVDSDDEEMAELKSAQVQFEQAAANATAARMAMREVLDNTDQNGAPKDELVVRAEVTRAVQAAKKQAQVEDRAYRRMLELQSLRASRTKLVRPDSCLAN